MFKGNDHEKMDVSRKLAEIKRNNLYRDYNTFSAPQEKQTVINGKKVLLFSSNSYLGIANNEEIKKKVIATVKKYGTGSGGSRLITGNYDLHMKLEHLLSAFKGSDAAIVFNSGYMTNIGTLSSLCDEHTVIFSDALNHASIIDGCRLSKGKTVIYAHNNIDDLMGKIVEVRAKKGFIVTDSVFSMDGDIAPLPDLVQIARDNSFLLMTDDAHATGVIGKTGRGIVEHFGLTHQDVDVVVGTLSKAVASEGGFVCGSAEMCDYLKNVARSFIFSTALSPANIAASIGGIEHLLAYPETTRKLQENICYFVNQLNSSGIYAASETAIIPIIVGDEAKAQKASAKLFTMGIFVPCVRYPTVKKGEARLRFTLMATHTHSDMDYAVRCLKDVL